MAVWRYRRLFCRHQTQRDNGRPPTRILIRYLKSSIVALIGPVTFNASTSHYNESAGVPKIFVKYRQISARSVIRSDAYIAHSNAKFIPAVKRA